MNRTVLTSFTILCLLSTVFLGLTFNIQTVKANGTIYNVGVETGDWIKYDYTVTGAPSGTILPTWMKVEFLSVEGTMAVVRVTMHMSDGTEPSDTLSMDVVAGGATFDTLFGFVIPANCTTGDSIILGGDSFTFNVTIDGETTRTYAEASRTVVYTSFSQYGTQLTYHWDKQTGVMVEASATSSGITGIARATETNMWQPGLFGFDPTLPYSLIIVTIVIVAAAAFFAIYREKKSLEEVRMGLLKTLMKIVGIGAMFFGTLFTIGGLYGLAAGTGITFTINKIVGGTRESGLFFSTIGIIMSLVGLVIIHKNFDLTRKISSVTILGYSSLTIPDILWGMGYWRVASLTLFIIFILYSSVMLYLTTE